jgi:hypothetical protein
MEELREKYKEHPYMKQKLEEYILHLPRLMQTVEDEYNKKQLKRKEHAMKCEEYKQWFLSKYNFYYIPQTETYIQYTDHFHRVSEDSIVQLICSYLDKTLITSKTKLVSNILKKIKETLLIQCTNVFVAKKVRSTLPFSKDHSTYFLTILGDFILSKKENMVYFLDPSFKPLLKVIHQSFCLFLHKPLELFKHKYHDHDYDVCRILPGNYKEVIIEPFSLIVAACTYSSQYGSSEGYLNTTKLTDVLILKENKPDQLIQMFLSSYTKSDNISISYKDIYFLWKTFLKKHSLPYVISQQNFKSILQQIKVCEGDICHNLSSTINTSHLKFKQFWDKYMIHDEDYWYDVQEIMDLFQSQGNHVRLEDIKDVLALDGIEADQILNYKCTLWDKNMDIDMSLEDTYESYVNYTKIHHKKCATRDYFDAYKK